MDSKRDHGDAVALIKRGHRMCTVEEIQDAKVVQRVDGHNGHEYEPEKRRKHREPHAYGLEQEIKDERHACVTRERDYHLHWRGGRRTRWGCNEYEQVQDASDSGPQAW